MSKVQYEYYESITPADGQQIKRHDAIYIGTGGNLYVKRTASSVAEKFAVPSGGLLPVKVYSIEATNTTATDIKIFRDV